MRVEIIETINEIDPKSEAYSKWWKVYQEAEAK